MSIAGNICGFCPSAERMQQTLDLGGLFWSAEGASERGVSHIK